MVALDAMSSLVDAHTQVPDWAAPVVALGIAGAGVYIEYKGYMERRKAAHEASLSKLFVHIIDGHLDDMIEKYLSEGEDIYKWLCQPELIRLKLRTYLRTALLGAEVTCAPRAWEAALGPARFDQFCQVMTVARDQLRAAKVYEMWASRMVVPVAKGGVPSFSPVYKALGLKAI